MGVSLLVIVLAAVGFAACRRDLDLDCPGCSRSLNSTDLPTLVRTGCCPRCGHPVPREDLDDLA
jgi:hypothetical protein